MEDGAEILQKRLLLGLFRYLIAAEEPGIFMAEADDLLDQVELSLGQDNPIVEAPPFIQVMLQNTKHALVGDELLRTGPITQTAALTLPIPRIRV